LFRDPTLAHCRLVTDRQTDKHTRRQQIPREHSVARVIKLSNAIQSSVGHALVRCVQRFGSPPSINARYAASSRTLFKETEEPCVILSSCSQPRLMPSNTVFVNRFPINMHTLAKTNPVYMIPMSTSNKLTNQINSARVEPQSKGLLDRWKNAIFTYPHLHLAVPLGVIPS